MSILLSAYTGLLYTSLMSSLFIIVLLFKYRVNRMAQAIMELALVSIGVEVSMLLSLYSSEVGRAIWWHANVRLAFYAFITPYGFFLVYRFVEQENTKLGRIYWWLLPIPILTAIFTTTNTWHHLYFYSYTMKLVDDVFLRSSWEPGVWFWVQASFSYVVSIWMLWLLGKWVIQKSKLLRYRGIVVFGVVLILVGALSLDAFLKTQVPGLFLLLGFWIMNSSLILGIWYLALFDAIPVAREKLTQEMQDGIFILDPNNKIMEVNPAAENILGYSTSNVKGKNIVDFIIPEERAEQANQLLEGEFHGVIPVGISGTERYFDVLVTGIYLENRNLAAKLVVLRDITEFRELQEQNLQRTAIEERQRLARDLHDAVSQTLFSAQITSEMLMRQKEFILPEKLWIGIDQIARLLKSALGEMRILLLELRPESLANTTLPLLLSHLTNAYSSRTDAEIHILIQGEYELPVDERIAIYRIAQEALNNIVKHSDASLITLKLTLETDYAQLIVEDNGKGITQGLPSVGNMGLSIMRERARGIGATLEINSQPGVGTDVICIWHSHTKEFTNAQESD